MIIKLAEIGKKYEANDERIDQVFEEVKEKAVALAESYSEDPRDATVAVLALCITANELKEMFENTFGYENILEILDAKEVE